MALTVEELQVLITANADQFKGELIGIRKELQKMNTQTKAAGNAFGRDLFGNILKANLATGLITRSLGVLTRAFQQIPVQINKAIDVSNEFESALIGLETVAGRRLGMQAIPLATKAAQDLAADGLLTVSDAATGLKNLLATGFGLEESIKLMNVFKDAAAFGRQGSLTFGQAVSTATQGIKNGNSILVDNAGITKNLSVILAEAGRSQQDLMRTTQDAAVRQDLYNGLLKEGAIFQGDAARLAQTNAGATAALGATIKNLQNTIGKFVSPVFRVLSTAISTFFSGINGSLITAEQSIRNTANRIAGYLIAVIRVIGRLGSALPFFGNAFARLANFSLAVSTANQDVTKSGNAAGNSLKNEGKEMDKTGQKAKKLAKDLNGLASFDELNVLTKPTEDTGTKGAVDEMTDAVSSGTEAIGGNLNTSAEDINKYADSATEKFNSIGKAIDSFLKPLREITVFGRPLLSILGSVAKWVGILNIGVFLGSKVFGILAGVFGLVLRLLVPIKPLLGAIGAVIAGMSTPILLAVGAITALVAGFALLYTQSEQFRNSINQLIESGFNWLRENVVPIFEAIGAKVQELVGVFEERWPAIQRAIQPLIDSTIKALVSAFQLLGKVIDFVWKNALKPMIDFVLATIVPAFTVFIDALVTVISTFTNVVSTILNVVMPVLHVLFDVFSMVFNGIKSVIAAAWNVIKPILVAVFDFFTKFVIPVVQLFMRVSEIAWNNTRMAVERAWQGVYNAIKPVLDWINSAIMPVVNKIKSGVEGAFNGLRAIVENIWNGLRNTIKNGINWIIDRINDFIRGVNGMLQSLDNSASSLGINVDFRVGQIPRLARGGTVTSPTIAALGEGGRKEVVLPLEQNTGWAQTMADLLKDAGGTSEGTNLVINIGGRKIYDGFVDFVNDQSVASGMTILNV